MDYSGPDKQERIPFLAKEFSISPGYKDMESNLFIVSMLLNGNPPYVKYDLTFATHLSHALVALVSHVMKDISCFNEIEVTGKQRILPVQPWVLWAFVIQELCKAMACLLSRDPSEVLLISIHPLQSVDSTLLEWEHHPSYMKWTSAHPLSSRPIDTIPLIGGYATSLKAAIGLLMISAARAFGPVSKTCGDFNILGYRDPDQPIKTPRNLYFGDPSVTVKNSPGIFIYEAGINVVEICKALEADNYRKMADELKDLAAEALFSSLTHMYPEKMQADLIAIEERIIPPVGKHHSLRATACEFHPSLAQPLRSRTMRQTPLSYPIQSPPLPHLAPRLKNAYRTPQSMRLPLGYGLFPSTATPPLVRPQEAPIKAQDIQAHTRPITATSVLAQDIPYSSPTREHDTASVRSVAVLPKLQIPQLVDTQRIPSWSPSFYPGVQIAPTANGYLTISTDSSLLAYQGAITQSEEQLFLNCRRTARRLLGLPVSPNPSPPPCLWSPPAFWYYPPALFSPGPVSVVQNPQAGLPAHSPYLPAGHYYDSLPFAEYSAAQYAQIFFNLANNHLRVSNTHYSIYESSPPDSDTYSDTRTRNPPLDSLLQPTPEVLYPEPARQTHGGHDQGLAFGRNPELSKHLSAGRQRRSRCFGSETRAHGRPLALHLDDYVVHPSRRSNR